MRGHSSVGRALEWHSRGQGFDSPWLHQIPVSCAICRYHIERQGGFGGSKPLLCAVFDFAFEDELDDGLTVLQAVGMPKFPRFARKSSAVRKVCSKSGCRSV